MKQDDSSPLLSESSSDEPEILSLQSLREAFARLEDAPENEPLQEGLEAPGAFLSVYLETENTLDDFEEEIPPEENDPELVENPDEQGEPIGATDRESGSDDPVRLTPATILEAMLFVGDRDNRPLTPEKAAELMRNVEPSEIDLLVGELNTVYRQHTAPYHIVRDKEGYRLLLREAFHPLLTKFYGKTREARLSQQAIDILAVVAYRQPMTAEDVQAIWKQPCSAILTQLVRRGLLSIERRMESKKRVLFYRTTARFLELFGLESLDDLPTPEEIDFR